MIKKFISVVVCTYNGGQKVVDCIKALEHQTYDKKKYEVILVNDGSSDNTVDFLRKSKFTVLSIPNGGLAHARNVGIEAAKGEIIAFTDDDCIPNADWIAKINEKFEDKQLEAISGMVLTYDTSGLIQKYIDATRPLLPLEAELIASSNIFFRFYLYMMRQINCVDHSRWNVEQPISSVVGANMAFKKSFLDKVDGFDNRLTFGGEDEEICYKFLKKNKDNVAKFQYYPDLIVSHKFEKEVAKAIKRNYAYGRGSVRMIRIHPERSLTLFPMQILLMLLTLVTLFFVPQFWWLAVLSIFVFYFHWVLFFFKQKKAYILTFPFIQFAFETSFNLGVVRQLLGNTYD